MTRIQLGVRCTGIGEPRLGSVVVSFSSAESIFCDPGDVFYVNVAVSAQIANQFEVGRPYALTLEEGQGAS